MKPMKITCRFCELELSIDEDHEVENFNCLFFGCPECSNLHLFPVNHKDIIKASRKKKLVEDLRNVSKKGMWRISEKTLNDIDKGLT